MVFLSRIFSRLYYCVSISIYRGFCVSNEETPSSSSSSDPMTRKSTRATPQNLTGTILIVRVCGSNPRIDTRKKPRPKGVYVLFRWRVTRAFRCCMYPAVKATGDRSYYITWIIQNTTHVQTRYFARFPAKEYVHFPDVKSRFYEG